MHVFLLALFLVATIPSSTARAEKILIIGASVTWGCVGTCATPQTEPGYLPRLRTMLPEHEIRAVTWFGAGVADWEPDAAPFAAQALPYPGAFPYGVGEYGAESTTNLWNLLGRPHMRDFKPDYVVVFLGAAAVLRALRDPPQPPLTGAEFEGALTRLTNEIALAGATPVVVFNTTCTADAAFLDPYWERYREALLEVCDEEHVRCGPDTFEFMDRVAHFVGTDGIHPNAAGHQVIAEQLAAWFQRELEHGPPAYPDWLEDYFDLPEWDERLH
jgi:lysophospholipase L1-like esterase